MTTETEELQAKEFLKRAEIRTMKKDLLQLREADSLTERDKIANIKTLDEQLEEKKKANELAAAKETVQKIGMKEVLQKNEGQEKIAEKDLKNYASEQERQQIFLLESQRLGFEKQIDAIDKQKDPALKLEKNKLLLQKRDQEAKLKTILDQEKKLEDEQKFLAEKAQTSTNATEKKGLEQSRWDLDKKIQDIEKKRWEAEKQVQDTDTAVAQLDKSSDALITEKNGLRDKVLGIDKSLRDVYSTVMAREEEKRKGNATEQIAKKEALAKIHAEQNEKVRAEQRGGLVVPMKKNSIKEKLSKGFEAEEEARKKFLQDVEQGSQIPGQQQQKSNIK